MYTLGLSCHYHDAAAALVHNGQLVAASSEERFTRSKHDSSYPRRAIELCLDRGNITADDLSRVVFYEKPFRKFKQSLTTIMRYAPYSGPAFLKTIQSWLSKKLFIKSTIINHLSISENQIQFLSHHRSHAASAFFASPFEEADFVTLDGVGEKTTGTTGQARYDKNGGVSIQQKKVFPNSIGLFYSAFTDYLGFFVNNGEGKVMGLAAYGVAAYRDELLDEVITINKDGGFALSMEYFSFPYSLQRSYTNRLVELLGPARNPEQTPLDIRTRSDLNAKQKRFVDIAASVQSITKTVVLRIIDRLAGQHKNTNLCLAGGVFLNSVINGEILRNTSYKNIYVQPAANDAGGALGAAFWGDYYYREPSRTEAMDHVYYGQCINGSDFNDANVTIIETDSRRDCIRKVVDKITNNKPVGLMRGRAEFGPRALGNRSIIADPRDQKIQSILNRKIKFREPFRPFAPTILASHAEEYLDIDRLYPGHPAYYMLMTCDIMPDKKQELAGVAHVDGTVRPQILRRKQNPFFYDLIEAFYQRTNVPAVINTSLNLSGDPIVNTVTHGIRVLEESGLNYLLCNQTLLRSCNKQ